MIASDRAAASTWRRRFARSAAARVADSFRHRAQRVRSGSASAGQFRARGQGRGGPGGRARFSRSGWRARPACLPPAAPSGPSTSTTAPCGAPGAGIHPNSSSGRPNSDDGTPPSSKHSKGCSPASQDAPPSKTATNGSSPAWPPARAPARSLRTSVSTNQPSSGFKADGVMHELPT